MELKSRQTGGVVVFSAIQNGVLMAYSLQFVKSTAGVPSGRGEPVRLARGVSLCPIFWCLSR